MSNENQILLINKNLPMRMMLRDLLESKGYDVFQASDCSQGLRMFYENPTKVVICDSMVSDIDSTDNPWTIQKNHEDVRYITIAGYDGPGDKKYKTREKEFGADCTLYWPLKPRKVVKAVRELLVEV